MAKPYSGPWVLRTLLFSPGHVEKYIQKATVSGADCVALDLEDAVPDSLKDHARNVLVNSIKSLDGRNCPVFVRVNPMDTGMTLLDLDAVACGEVSGFVYPKALRPDDIKAFDAQLSLKEKVLRLEQGHFDIIVLVETPQAVLHAYDLAVASRRVIGLLFGSEDFLTDMQGLHAPEDERISAPRHLVAMAARAAGVVPIDAPFVQVHNEDGLRAHIVEARELGFEGMLVMSPRQIQIAKSLYTPSAEMVSRAREMVRLANDATSADRGIALSGGTFVSPPTLRRAELLLSRYEAIQTFDRRRLPDVRPADSPGA